MQQVEVFLGFFGIVLSKKMQCGLKPWQSARSALRWKVNMKYIAGAGALKGKKKPFRT